MIKESVGMDLPSAAADDLQDAREQTYPVNSADIKKTYIDHGDKRSIMTTKRIEKQ
jgi:hypothetical protein